MIAADLVFVGRAAVPALLQITRHGDTVTTSTAVRALGEIRDPVAAGRLIKLLLEAEALDVRAQAAGALGKIGDRPSVDALVKALHDDAWEVRAQAAKALGRSGDPRSVPALESAMPDSSWWVRVNCGEALTALGESGRDALRRLTHSSDRYAAEQADSALAVAESRRLRTVSTLDSTTRRTRQCAPTPRSAQVAS
jgi:HEAT repeat protein